MKYIFNPIYVKENEILFYIFLIVILLIIILTTIFVIKEVNKNKSK
jgi:heme/copper-type cytochrome/quinol oxidase subunit 4